MQHPLGQPGQAAQAARLVQIAQQRRHTGLAQGRKARLLRGQGQHARAAPEGATHAQTYIAAAHDKYPAAAKARWQRAQGGLV